MERLNQTLIERVCALLHASQFPMALWGKALMHIVWLKNWTSTKLLLGCTPYEVLTKEKPDLSELCEWGKHVWVHNPDNPKLKGHAREGRWIGFDPQSHASHVCGPTNKVSPLKEMSNSNGNMYLCPKSNTCCRSTSHRHLQTQFLRGPQLLGTHRLRLKMHPQMNMCHLTTLSLHPVHHCQTHSPTLSTHPHKCQMDVE